MMSATTTAAGTHGWQRYRIWGFVIAALSLGATYFGLQKQTGSNTGKSYEGTQQTTQTGAMVVNDNREIATLAGGCFWCIEEVFKELKGVDTVVSGYSGGQRPNPSYEQVCTGVTGHAESVQIVFDPKVISFKDLLHVFFTVHDPTTLNRQGADAGTQYRSAIFYHSPEQKATAEEVIREIDSAKVWSDPIVTEVTKFTEFYPAEDYHQNYYERNPEQGYCRIVIAPKVAKFRAKYIGMLKK
jgi:peptide-methionine (S)-S-oxide reductase